LWIDRSTDVYVELGWPVNESARSKESERGEASTSVRLMRVKTVDRVTVRKEKMLLVVKADDSS